MKMRGKGQKGKGKDNSLSIKTFCSFSPFPLLPRIFIPRSFMNLNRKKVLVLTGSWYWEKVRLLEENGVAVQKVLDGKEDLFYAECGDAQAVVPGLTPISRPMMEKTPHLLIIAAHGWVTTTWISLRPMSWESW